MPDYRFFKAAKPVTLGEIAAVCGVGLEKGADPARLIRAVAPLDQAGPDDLSFLDNVRYREAFRHTKAGACIVAPDMVAQAPAGTVLLVSKTPYKSYALAAQILYPEERPAPSIAPEAIVDPSAVLGRGCIVEAGAVIGQGVEIGEGTWVEAGAVIRSGVRIGRGCRIGANAVVSHALIGDHVRVYPGCCIGQDGFGFAIDPAGHVKVPQLGRVIIGDGVEIGANTTIDRGSGPDTEIGAGTWIDNLVQIGHNVKIGKGCVIVAQTGIAGSAVLEDYVVLAGQVGVAGHLRIGKGAKVAAQSGIIANVPAGAEFMGYPALPIRQFLRQIAWLKRMALKKGHDGEDS